MHSFKDVHETWVRSIVISSDKKYIISGSEDKTIKIHNLKDKSLLKCIEDAHNDYVRSVAITSDNKFIVSASED